MKPVALCAVLMALVVPIGASSASAASITYDLNCMFSGPTNAGICSPNGSFGTVTVSDNAYNSNWIDLTVDLIPQGTLGTYLKNLYLNYGGPSLSGPPEYEWKQSTTIDKITHKTNDVGAAPNSGAAYQYLDVEVQQKGPLIDPWTGTIKLKLKNATDVYYDLDPSTFNFLSNDTANDGQADALLTPVWAAVYREVQTQPSSTFTLVGSITPTPVTEPGTLLLLGIGLVGLSALGLRARKP